MIALFLFKKYLYIKNIMGAEIFALIFNNNRFNNQKNYGKI